MGVGQRLVAALLFCMASPALAAPASTDLNTPALPTFALESRPADPSPWAGLYVGTEVFGFTGGKGVRGGFGGGGYAGYRHELDSGIVVGVQGNVGYVPGFFRRSAVTGFEYGSTEVTVGYDMGRFMPFVTAGVGLAQPNYRSFGYGGAANVATDLFNSNRDLRAFETAGAGFAYRINDKMTVELAVQAFRSNGGFVAP